MKLHEGLGFMFSWGLKGILFSFFYKAFFVGKLLSILQKLHIYRNFSQKSKSTKTLYFLIVTYISATFHLLFCSVT